MPRNKLMLLKGIEPLSFKP